MSASMEYKGKDVEQAITNACAALGVSREDLEIQVVATGSAGFLGLGRKPAVIRVRLRAAAAVDAESAASAPSAATPAGAAGPAPTTSAKGAGASATGRQRRQQRSGASGVVPGRTQGAPGVPTTHAADGPGEERAGDGLGPDGGLRAAAVPMAPLNGEELAVVRATAIRLLELSLGPAEVEVQQEPGGGKLRLNLAGPEPELLVGPEGQTLEALQYLLRKILSKQLGRRVALELDAAGFRARRRGDLESRARSLAAEVKAGGKSRSFPAMGPAERRIVHLALEGDPEIRSRSVGEGIFKKVLIHSPGKVKPKRRRKR